MLESPQDDTYSIPLVELVEKIVVKGTINPQDEEKIRQCAAKPLDHIDIKAISKLTTLIREGQVKVV